LNSRDTKISRKGEGAKTDEKNFRYMNMLFEQEKTKETEIIITLSSLLPPVRSVCLSVLLLCALAFA
jgi:hypothetical protein